MFNRRSSIFSLLFAVAMLITTLLAPAANAGGGEEAYFEPFSGNDNVFSEVYIDRWENRDGDFVAELTIYPSQDEIEALLEEGDEPQEGSHVDLAITFIGLETSGGGHGYSVDWSDHIRFIGPSIDSESENPTVEVLGSNLERWDDRDYLTVTVVLYGYESYERNFGVAVELTSSTWWPETNGCTVDYERDSDGDGEADEFFCSKQHRSTSLVSWEYGDDLFTF